MVTDSEQYQQLSKLRQQAREREARFAVYDENGILSYIPSQLPAWYNSRAVKR